MAQLGFKIDLSRCVGCKACALACMQEMNTVPGVRYRRVIQRDGGVYPVPKRMWVTMACFHCKDPACLMACPVSPYKTDLSDPRNCIRKDAATGIVTIDQSTCIGCKYCIAACPYGAPQFNEATETVEKCTLCVHRITDTGGAYHPAWKPACVATCPAKALELVENPVNAATPPVGFADPKHTNPAVDFKWGGVDPW